MGTILCLLLKMASMLCVLLLLGNVSAFLFGDALRIIGRQEWSLINPVLETNFFPSFKDVEFRKSANFSHMTVERCIRRARRLERKYITQKGWKNIPYHFLICGEGTVLEGLGWYGKVPEPVVRVNYFRIRFLVNQLTAAATSSCNKLTNEGIRQGYFPVEEQWELSDLQDDVEVEGEDDIG